MSLLADPDSELAVNRLSSSILHSRFLIIEASLLYISLAGKDCIINTLRFIQSTDTTFMMPSHDFLPAQQAELQRLGFEIKKVEPESLIVAAGTLFYWDYFLHSIKYTLFIRKGQVLSGQVLENDRSRFTALEEEVHPKSWSYFGPKTHKLLVVYLADIVNTDAQQLCEKKKDIRIFDRTYFVGAIDLTTGQKFIDKSNPGIGGIYYSKVYHLLNRLLDPLNTPVKRPFSKWSGLLSVFLSPWVVLVQFLLLFGFVLELGSLIARAFSWLN